MKAALLLLALLIFCRSYSQCTLTWERAPDGSGSVSNYSEMLANRRYIEGPDGRSIRKSTLNHYLRKGPRSLYAIKRTLLNRELKCHPLNTYRVDGDSIAVYTFFYCAGDCAIDEPGSELYYTREFGIIYRSKCNVWHFELNIPNWVVNNSCLTEKENIRMRKLVDEAKASDSRWTSKKYNQKMNE